MIDHAGQGIFQITAVLTFQSPHLCLGGCQRLLDLEGADPDAGNLEHVVGPAAVDIAAIVADKGTGREAVIPILQAIQEKYNYLPEEALRHCTSVVVGEAEPLWGRLVADFRAGRLDIEMLDRELRAMREAFQQEMLTGILGVSPDDEEPADVLKRLNMLERARKIVPLYNMAFTFVIGGPVAYYLLGGIVPESMGDQAWKGLAAMSGSWIGCSTRRSTASAGRATGWTWSTSAKLTATTRTSCVPTLGPIAIMSFGR